jgi:carboxymethylenebutenolidase
VQQFVVVRAAERGNRIVMTNGAGGSTTVAAMTLHEEIVDAPTDDGDMAVLVKQPATPPTSGTTWPTVLILHDGPGIREATHVFMRKLATEGYRVICPDLYHRKGRLFGVEPAMRAADPSVGEKMREWLSSLHDDGIQHDVDRALAAAAPNARSIAVLGFCLGARAVMRTMLRLPDLVVAGATWHPSFLVDAEPDSPHLLATNIRQPVYIGIGTADQVQSIEMHQRFFDAVEPLDNFEVEIFEGADHGFTWPDHPTYHQVAADGCWAKTTALFRAAFS